MHWNACYYGLLSHILWLDYDLTVWLLDMDDHVPTELLMSVSSYRRDQGRGYLKGNGTWWCLWFFISFEKKKKKKLKYRPVHECLTILHSLLIVSIDWNMYRCLICFGYSDICMIFASTCMSSQSSDEALCIIVYPQFLLNKFSCTIMVL